MTDFPPIVARRLVLRPWTEADREPFAVLSADAVAMEYLRPLTTRAASDAWIDRQIAHQSLHGFSMWAVAEKASGLFVGAVGLARVGYEAHFTPAVEIGWRIARPFWGRGYAPEGAAAALGFGFGRLHLPEIVANACVGNAKSRRVMAKLGMAHDPEEDFAHPLLAAGDPLQPQVLARLSHEQWLLRPPS